MPAISRFLRAGTVALGLLVGCDDELGRDRYVWDSNSPTRGTGDAARMSDGALDHDGEGAEVSDVSVDPGAREASNADGLLADAGASDVSLDVRVDGLIDSSESGTLDWGDGGAIRAVLLAESPSCLACAEASCPSEIVGCSTIPGKSDGGPEAGLSRSQLCAETLECVVSTGCEALDTSTCYCGDVVFIPGACEIPTVANGMCKSALERSLETTDPKALLSSLLSTDRAGGWAMLLSRCLRDNQCRTCFPSVDAGADVKSAPSSNEFLH